ncbi:hypothetical protein CJU89_1178 [Yarrowia sp. B02]|nr:hypothetical protein CJU89_1178 [Yarrowia sp. B02]
MAVRAELADGVDEANRLYRLFQRDLKTAEAQSRELMTQLERDLKAVRTKLAVPATKEDALSAVNEICDHQKRLVRLQYEAREHIKSLVAENQERRKKLQPEYKVFKNIRSRAFSKKHIEEFESRAYDFEYNMHVDPKICVSEANDDIVLQFQILEMLEGQPEEVRDWVLIENNRLHARFPWIHLEPDMPTWAGCLLVYTKRVTAKKEWSTTKDIGCLRNKRPLTPMKAVVATMFKGDVWNPKFKQFSADSRWKHEFLLNLKVGQNEHGEVTVKTTQLDKEVVLPAGVKMHYKNAICDYREDTGAFELGQDFVMEGYKPLLSDKVQKSPFNFWDNFAKKFRRYNPKTLAKPVASHAELIW